MGFFSKIKEGLAKTRNNISNQLHGMFDSFTGANDEFFDELEETLILADVGVEIATDCVDKLCEIVKKNGIRGGEEIKAELAKILGEIVAFEDNSIKSR